MHRPVDDTPARYDRAHELWEFERAYGPTHRLHHKVVGRFLENRLRGCSVVDVGCGDGYYSHRLAQTNRVVSTDLSLSSVLATQFRRDGASRACVASAVTLPFPDHSVDAVVALEVFEHIADDRAAVEECVRIIRPGGTLLFSVPADPRLYSSIDAEDGHYRRYTEEELRGRLFAGFGLEELLGYGFVVMPTYYRWLSRFYSVERPPAATRTLAARAAMQLVYALFHLDFVAGNRGRGIQLFGAVRV